MKLLLLIVSITFVTAQLPSSHSSSPIENIELKNVQVRETFDLLDEGQQNIILSEHRNFTLILGNTGSGKSTFILWLLDNEQLKATRTADRSYIIEDGNKRIGHSTIHSKTLFPELMIDNTSNDAYYDCPGFSDTRSTSHNIAITYFIKRVADHARKVKLVFIINYSSLRKGVDRMDFMKLLSHATDLIKDVNKFRDSIAIVATKVDNSYEEDEDGVLVLVPDDDVINGIAEFLVEVKDALAKNPSKVKYVQLVNLFLLTNSDGSFDRIGIFRRPTRAGPLSKNEALQKGKNHVKRILNRIVYSGKSVDDFGYTVSDRSKSDITYLIADIGVTVEINLDKIGKIIVGNFYESIKMVEMKLDVFVTEDVDVNVNEEIKRANGFLISGIREILGLMGKMKSIKNPRELVEIIGSFVSDLKYYDVRVNETLDIISKQGEYFDFLQLVSKQTFLTPKTWASNFESKAQNLSNLHTKFQNNIKSFIEQVVYQVDGLFSSIGHNMYDHYKEIVERMKERINLRLNNSFENVNLVEVSKMKENLNDAVNITFNLIQDIQLINNLSLLGEKVIASVRNIPINESMNKKLKKFLSFLNDHKYNEVKMRKSWATLFENEVLKLSNFNQEFESRAIAWLLEIEGRIEDLITIFGHSLSNHYELKLNDVKIELGIFTNQNSGFYRDVDLGKAKEMAFNLNNGLTIMSNISMSIQSLSTPSALKSIINDAISNINGFYIEENFMKNISFQLEILNFALMASDYKFETPKQWSNIMKNVGHSFNSSLNFFLKNDLHRTRETVYSSIKSDLEAAAQKIIDHFELITSNEKTNILLANLKNAENEIARMLTKNTNESGLFTYLNNILDCVTKLDIDKKMINQGLKRYEYLEYMREFSESQLISAEPLHNFEPFDLVRKFLNESHVWFTFLLELDLKLSRYEIQSDASRYNVANFDNWGKVNKLQGISINKINFFKFLAKLNISGDIKTVEITDSRLTALDNVLAINLRSKYEIICDENDGKIVLRGNFVKFSDLTDEKNNVFRNSCNFNVLKIDIFASKTVFIDRNFIAVGSQFRILLIAPKWEVIGLNRSIVLDGADSRPRVWDRAKSGKNKGSRGEDGSAGLPGGSAGSFVGIGRVFINGNALRVSADGGRGGRGQDGGHGIEGEDGDFVQLHQIDGREKFRYSVSYDRVGDDYLAGRLRYLGLKHTCVNRDYMLRCTAFGKSGGKGGDGGNGGTGGFGGKEGEVEIIELGECASGIRQSNSSGLMGEKGQGGEGGKGGESQKVEFDYSNNFLSATSQYSFFYEVNFKFLENIKLVAENGKPGC